MKRLLLSGVVVGVLAWLAPTASAATNCSFAGDTLTIGFTNSTGVVVRRDDPPSTAIKLQEFQVAGFVNCGATTPTVENTNHVNITDNGAGASSEVELDLVNGPFRDAGGAEIEFDVDLNDGSDSFFLGSDPGAMNFRFGNFLGTPFVNRNAGTDNTPDTVV